MIFSKYWIAFGHDCGLIAYFVLTMKLPQYLVLGYLIQVGVFSCSIKIQDCLYKILLFFVLDIGEMSLLILIENSTYYIHHASESYYSSSVDVNNYIFPFNKCIVKNIFVFLKVAICA